MKTILGLFLGFLTGMTSVFAYQVPQASNTNTGTGFLAILCWSCIFSLIIFELIEAYKR